MAQLDRIYMGSLRSGWEATFTHNKHTYARKGTVIEIRFSGSRIVEASILGGPRDMIAESINYGTPDKANVILKWMERPVPDLTNL
ncbi:hypothetical protein SEA_SKOG_81 [Gordonia phage Skog]|uniref:Uncharacterized protein n=1 Tax=Gordonia phage Skog TaxID=2704033 RepID=A0A6G6XKD1_9CAUD|nr:hypothetical protein KHQ85_gp081 [Gordonia phage Skog]QIG58233.1 hypothetical protein SEA_SKOG_81 [Gordonia phage Skog]